MDAEEQILIRHGYEPREAGEFPEGIISAAKEGPLELLRAFVLLGAPLDARTDHSGPPIVAAAEGDSIERIELLLAHGVDLEAKDGSGDTALHTAANWGHGELVARLAKRGARVNTCNGKNFTPLSKAVNEKNVPMVERLLSLGADPQWGLTEGVVSALWFAQQDAPLARLLLDAGADPNLVRKDGTPMLQIAASWGVTEVVALFLERGARIEEGPFGWTAWMEAASRKHGSVCEILEAHGAQPVDMRRTQLFEAARSNEVEAARRLLDEGVSADVRSADGGTALGAALNPQAKRAAGDPGSFEVAELLMERGASTQLTNREGDGALSNAAYLGRSDWVERLLAFGTASIGPAIYACARKGHTELALMLIERADRAQLDAADQHGQTAVYLAAAFGRVEILEALARRGADLERASKKTAAIHIAVDKCQAAVIEVLARHGADLDRRDFLGSTPLGRAAGHLTERHSPGLAEVGLALLKAGADYTLTAEIGQATPYERAKSDQQPLAEALKHALAVVPMDASKTTPAAMHCFVDGDLETIRTLFERGLPIEACTGGDHPPFIAAAKLEDPSIASLMLERGADPNTWYRGFGSVESVLGAASSHGHVELVRALLARGADPNRGEPLMKAAREGQLEIMQLLIDAGAKVTPRRGGWTPLHGAAIDGHRAACELLLAHGADPSVRTQQLQAPLDLAREKDHLDCVELLAKVTPADMADASGATPLYQAVIAGNLREISALIESGADPDRPAVKGETARHAAKLRREVADLLNVTYEPRIPRKQPREPEAFHALYRGEPLPERPDLELANERGDTLLHAAIIAGRIDVAHALLVLGSDPRRENLVGETPWSLAMAYCSKSAELQAALATAGAKIDVNKQVEAYQHEQGLAIALRDGDLRAVDAMIDRREVSLHVGRGGGPLYGAIIRRDEEMIRMLVDKGADVDVRVGLVVVRDMVRAGERETRGDLAEF